MRARRRGEDEGTGCDGTEEGERGGREECSGVCGARSGRPLILLS